MDSTVTSDQVTLMLRLNIADWRSLPGLVRDLKAGPNDEASDLAMDWLVNRGTIDDLQEYKDTVGMSNAQSTMLDELKTLAAQYSDLEEWVNNYSYNPELLPPEDQHLRQPPRYRA